MVRDGIETVVVTGASAGLGRAIVCEFAKHGARVGLLARGRKGLEGAAAEVRTAGGAPLILEADVSDANAVENAAATAEAELGPIDIWVNNAMVSVFSPVSEMQAEEYKRVTDVTYLGVVNGSLAALRRMLHAKPRQDRTGRLGPRLPQHTAAIRLLRREARHRWLYRFAAL